MGEAKRRRQAAGGSGKEPPDRGGIKVDDQLLTRIAALSHPHVEAVVKALIKAFPDNNEYPVLLYAPALACQLGVVLHIAGANQKHAVKDINRILTARADEENNYRLIRLADKTDDGDLGTMTVVDEQLFKRIIEVSTPHMDATRDAVAAAFSGKNPLNIYGIALALELSRLLNGLSSIDRSHTVNVINMTLGAAGCMLRSDQALERILDQRDRDLYDQGGLPGVVLNLISNADTRKTMDAGGIARHLFPDSPAIEQAALSGIIHRSLEAWSTEAPENPTHH
jgi:hypothetical protein